MTILSNLAIRDIETLAHPNTNLAALRETGPLVLEHGKGVFVHDSEGKAYLEGMAGLWCTALGYGNEELAENRRRADEEARLQPSLQPQEPRSGHRACREAQGH